MGVLKRLPVIGKDLLEDTPVPRGCCNHRVAPSGGDTIVTVQRLYHALAASSTPHRPVYGPPQPPRSSLINGSFRDRKNAFSYTLDIWMYDPIFDDGICASLEWQSAKYGDERFLFLSLDCQLQAFSWAVWRLCCCVKTLGLFCCTGLVLTRQGFQERCCHRPFYIS